MVTISVEFECGETTCAKEPGEFCRFFGTTHFGQVAVCTLFNCESLSMVEGWTRRCKQCLELEEK